MAPGVPPPDQPLDKNPRRIGDMFDAIAPRYDLLNHLLSLGWDRRWRRHAIRALALGGCELVVDLCTGTGDLAFEARCADPAPARILGIDVAPAMLRLAQTKARVGGRTSEPPVWFLHADAGRLPLPSESVDVVTIAFGIRNVQDLAGTLDEIARVLRPGGRLAILEFGLPSVPLLAGLYAWYFRRVLPVIGRVVSGHASAYAYLPASVAAFPAGASFADRIGCAGFRDVSVDRLTLGIVYLYVARRPERCAEGHADGGGARAPEGRMHRVL